MESLTEKIQEMEKEEILNALRESGWVMSRAARRLGITERMIGYKIKKYKIKREVKFIEGEYAGDLRHQV
jgi:transcriptional regulator with GAF, ATPase, and Fis domain